MAKHARGRYRKTRRWYKNIGDPIKFKHDNPNDRPLVRK